MPQSYKAGQGDYDKLLAAYNELLKVNEELKEVNKAKDRRLISVESENKQLQAKVSHLSYELSQASQELEALKEVKAKYAQQRRILASSNKGLNANLRVGAVVMDSLIDDGTKDDDGYVTVAAKFFAPRIGVGQNTANSVLSALVDSGAYARKEINTFADGRPQTIYRYKKEPGAESRLLSYGLAARSERSENWGGSRVQRCPKCQSENVVVSIHTSGLCRSCEHVWDKWDEYPDESTTAAPGVGPIELPQTAPVELPQAGQAAPGAASWQPDFRCFCGTHKKWFWSTNEQTWVCWPCLSPVEWTQNRLAAQVFQGGSQHVH